MIIFEELRSNKEIKTLFNDFQQDLKRKNLNQK